MPRPALIPTSISPKAKTFMKNLLGVLGEKSINTKLDSAAISLIAHTYDNYINATEILKKEGLVITSFTAAGENPKAHPAVKIQLDAQIQLTRLLIEFGLTPKSRKDVVSVKVDTPTKAGSPIDDFIGRQREVR
jgi:P27 family predicted phage terminase small subunit